MVSSDIIQRAGGDERVAVACGISLDALRKWRDSGRVPSKHWGVMAGIVGTSLEEIAAAKLKAANAKSKKRRAQVAA